MRTNEVELAEKNSNLAGIALYHQGSCLFFLVLLLDFNFTYFRTARDRI